jgi:hypothetical protein
MSFFSCLGRAKESFQVRGHLKHFVTNSILYSEGLLSPRKRTPQAGRPPIVCCARLLIQYRRRYPTYLEAFPPSATWGRSIPWWQGAHLTWILSSYLYFYVIELLWYGKKFRRIVTFVSWKCFSWFHFVVCFYISPIGIKSKLWGNFIVANVITMGSMILAFICSCIRKDVSNFTASMEQESVFVYLPHAIVYLWNLWIENSSCMSDICILWSKSRNDPPSMELYGSLPSSQDPAVGPHLEPDEVIPHTRTPFFED